MTNREHDISALLSQAKTDLIEIQTEYERSLESQYISSSLKIKIKGLCENLRSALDYLAHDVKDKYCPSNPKTDCYFPIISKSSEFSHRLQQRFPDLTSTCPQICTYFESIQPYQSSQNEWLLQFNTVTTANKHQNLVEQTRVETTRIEAKSQFGGSVSWDPNAVKFGAGVSINGVPVDTRTQLPQASPTQTVTRTIWVDFRFSDPDVSVLPFLTQCVTGIQKICDDVRGML